MIKISIFLLLALVATKFDISDAKLDHCPDDRRKAADECARDVFFMMDPNFKPATEASFPEYCQKMDKNIKCIDQYSKDCLKGITRQSMKAGVTGFKKLYKKICPANAPKKAEFLQRTAWMKKDDVDELYTCAGGAIKNYKYKEKVDNDNQIQQGCCNYYAARDCMDKKLKKLTTAENIKFMNQLSDETMTGLMSFLCSKQNSVTACRSIMPKELARMEKTIKSVKKGEREESESFLIPFLKILTD